MRRITINDIAREAGVSKTAVSFAFNAPEQLALATVQHIRQIAEQLGYTPDPIARSMTTRRTGAIGLLLPHDIPQALSNPFYTQFIRGIGQVCERVGLTLMLVPPLHGSRLAAIPVAAVDGFIAVGLEMERGEIQQLQRRGVPFVIVDSSAPPEVAAVNVDDRGGARAAMEYVLARGHRDILILALEAPPGSLEAHNGTAGARMAGYRDALLAHGIPANTPEVHVVAAASSWAGGRTAFDKVWAAGRRPTAVVAMSDILAIGAMDAASAQRLRLPDDLSVIGFDDLPDAQYVHPSLTTVRQPVEQKGLIAAEMLVAGLNNGARPEQRTLPTELVVRRSVMAPRHSGEALAVPAINGRRIQAD